MRGRWLVMGLVVLGWAGCSSNSNNSSSSNPDYFAVGRGSYLVNSVSSCADCHTSDPSKPFAGGTQFPVDAAGHYVYSRNLTPDPATGLQLTEDQFVQVFQTGADFKHDGESLLVMPWPNFRWMTTDDIKAIYAFLKVLPAVSNAVPDDNKGTVGPPVPLPSQYDEGEETRPLPPTSVPNPLGPPGSDAVPDPDNAVRGAALLPLAYAKMPNFYKRTPEEQASFGRGSYLVNAAGCSECHTNKGGLPRDFTPGPTFLKIPIDSYLTGGATFSVPGPLNAVLMQTRSMSANLVGPSGFFNEPKTTYLEFASIIDAMEHTDQNPPLSLGWPMPAQHFRTMSESDLLDVYTYMKILAEDYDHTAQTDKKTQDPARYCTTDGDCQPGQKCFVDGSADKRVNNQCIGQSCTADPDCGACQKCVSGACQQPDPSDGCLLVGL